MKRLMMAMLLMIIVVPVMAYSNPATPQEVIAGWTATSFDTPLMSNYAGIVYIDSPLPSYETGGTEATGDAYANAYCSGNFGSEYQNNSISYSSSNEDFIIVMNTLGLDSVYNTCNIAGGNCFYIPGKYGTTPLAPTTNTLYSPAVYCKNDANQPPSGHGWILTHWFIGYNTHASRSSVTFTTIDSETLSPVSGTSVNVGNGTVITTDESGTASFSMVYGNYTASATKSGYTGSSTSYTASTATTAVTIYLTSTASTATFRAVNSATFVLIPGATITAGDGQSGTTGSDGTVTFTMTRGSYTASGSKSGFTLTSGGSPYTLNTASATVPVFFSYIGTPTPTPTPTTTPSSGMPHASFSNSQLYGGLPLTITLTDTSTDGGSTITNRQWGYYDPSGNFYNIGTGSTATITATAYGVYSVIFRVDNANGYGTSSQYLFISSTATPTPTPTATPVPTATTPVPVGGGIINWGKTTYQQGDTATATYSISQGYWDQSAYNYSMRIVDNYGSTKSTTAINTQSGTITKVLDSATYPTGIYYANLHMNGKSTSVDYTMNLSKMTLNGYVGMGGYVMNSTDGSVISGAIVYAVQGTKATSSTSSSTGFWNSTNTWDAGTAMTVNTTKTGYNFDLRTFTPIKSGTITLNISLAQSSPSYSSIVIGGTARDGAYGNPVVGATVTATNVSRGESYTTTTNIAGGYVIQNLGNNVLYNLVGTKTEYSNSIVYQKLAVGS